MKRILMLVLVGLSLAGCELQLKHPSIFENPVCVPPCWENITPGITTRDELSQMLKQNPKAFDIRESVGYPWGPVISWCEGGSPCGPGYISAFASFDTKGIVQEINLDPGVILQLKDFLSLYGPPEKIAFSDPISGPGFVAVDVLYPDLGLAIEFYLENQGSYGKPAVDFREDLHAIRIFYTVPGLDYYYSHNIMVRSIDQLQQFEWKGYTHYP